MKYEYLIFDLLIFISPFIAKYFFVKLNFPDLKRTIISTIITASIFTIWDNLVVGYFWEFNPQYITGIYLLRLPLEEWVFFLVVPYACLFIWQNLENRFNDSSLPDYYQRTLIILLLLLSVWFFIDKKLYTSSDLFIFSIVIWLDMLLQTNLIFTIKGLLFTIITLILTFVFNYYLTARPVVLYAPEMKTNINFISIPVEDFIFGLSLMYLEVIIYIKSLEKSRGGKMTT